MRKIVLFIAVTVFLSLAITGVAYATHTPLEIYNDWAADHDFDETYSAAELQACLDDATLHQYASAAVMAEFHAYVEQVLTQMEEPGGGRGEFPFTGAQLALMGIAAFALIGAGVLIHRAARRRS